MNDEKITVWVSKDALTSGVQEVQGYLCERYSNTVFIGGIFPCRFPHWHRTLDDALTQAELMRTKKIESLRKTLKKMENLKIKVIAPGAER